MFLFSDAYLVLLICLTPKKMSMGQNEKWNSNQLIKIPRKKIKTLVFQALNPFPPGQLSYISCCFHVLVTDTEGLGGGSGEVWVQAQIPGPLILFPPLSG